MSTTNYPASVEAPIGHVLVPQPQYEALMAAAKAGKRLRLEFDFMIERGLIPDVRGDVIFKRFDEALAALRAAGIETEE